MDRFRKSLLTICIVWAAQFFAASAAHCQSPSAPEGFDSPAAREELDNPFRLQQGQFDDQLLDRRELGQLLRPLRSLRPQRSTPSSATATAQPRQQTGEIIQVTWQEETKPQLPSVDNGFTLRQKATQQPAPAIVVLTDPQPAARPLDDQLATPPMAPAAQAISPQPPTDLTPPAALPTPAETPPQQPTFLGPALIPEIEQSWQISDSVLNMRLDELRTELHARQQLVESSSNLSDQDKTARLNLIGSGLDSIGIASQNISDEARLRQRIQGIDQQLSSLEAQLAAPSSPRETDPALSLNRMQVLLRDLETSLDNENRLSRKIEGSVQHRHQRKSKIPAERIAFRKQLDELQSEMVLKQDNATEEFTALLALRAREIETSSAIALLETESEWFSVSQRLFPMQKDLHERTIDRLKIEIKRWGETIAARRHQILQDQIREAVVKARDAHPALRDLATSTAEITRIRVEISEKIKRVGAEKFKVTTLVHDLEIEQTELEKAVQRIGSEASSRWLIESHHTLIPPYESMARIRKIKEELLKTKVEELKLKQNRRPLVNENRFISEELGIVGDQPIANTTLKEMAKSTVVAHRKQIDELLREYDDYITVLGETEKARENLLAQISGTRKFIDERALWVQSADTVGLGVLLKSQEGARHFFDPIQWLALGTSIMSHVESKPYEPVLGLLGLLTVFGVGRKLKQKA